jgi:hypothetical protein
MGFNSVDFTCAECGQGGANVFVAKHALRSNPWYHSSCLHRVVKCGKCGKELPLGEMLVSYWHAFELRCQECEEKAI